MNKILYYVSLCVYLHFSAIQGWDAILVPVSFDENTKEWNVLLGKNYDNTWSVFRKQGQETGTAPQYAPEALKEQTNNSYTLSSNFVNKIPSVRLSNNDVVHFVPVKFIPAPDIFTRVKNLGGNNIKKDYAWLPINEIIDHETITKPARGRTRKYTFSQGIRRILIDHWDKALQMIGTKAAEIKEGRPEGQVAAGNGWFGIPGAIYFYNRSEPYFEFTNFAEYKISLDGKQWPTSEHYYQAQKFYSDQTFKGSNIWDYIIKHPKASDVFNYVNPGQGAKAPRVRNDWKAISIPVMLKAVRAKFNEHQKLKNLLLTTRDAILVENAGKKDNFYGAGENGMGQNLLGQILMRVRDELSGKIDPDEDFICYEKPTDYFKKQNEKVCAQGTAPSRSAKKLYEKKPIEPKKVRKHVQQKGSELELQLNLLRTELHELLNKIAKPALAIESVFLKKEEEPLREESEGEEITVGQWFGEKTGWW